MRFKTADEAIKAIEEVRWAPGHILSTLHRIKNDLENKNGNWYGLAEQASRLLDTLDEVNGYAYELRLEQLLKEVNVLHTSIQDLKLFHNNEKCWRDTLHGLGLLIKEVKEDTKKELLFYAQYEVTASDGLMFEAKPKSRWAEFMVLPLEDAPWAKVGQKIAIEVAYYTGPGGSKQRVTTITPLEKEAEE